MKKVLFILLIISILTSCKKKYTCDCNTIVKSSYNTSNSYSITLSADKQQYSEKMKKKQAESACEHQRNAIETNFKNNYKGTNSYQIVSGDVVVTTCSITS